MRSRSRPFTSRRARLLPFVRRISRRVSRLPWATVSRPERTIPRRSVALRSLSQQRHSCRSVRTVQRRQDRERRAFLTHLRLPIGARPLVAKLFSLRSERLELAEDRRHVERGAAFGARNINM